MGAYVSEKMVRALELLRAYPTMTAYRAAILCDLSRSAISQSREYRALVQQRKEESKNAK